MRGVFRGIGIVLVWVLLALNLTRPSVAGESIAVGGIFDITGPTSQVGKEYAQGALAAARYINDQGGVNGTPIKLIANDYGYKIPEAITLYKRYKEMSVPVIQGWGTGDTNALKSFITRDKIVYMSASYDANLDDPQKTPYNFFVMTSYSDSIRLAMQFIKETWKEKRPPKVVFIYPNHPYGKNPIPAGKAMAKELGFEIGPDEIVELRAIDATYQMLHMKRFNPDWAWVGGTSPSVAIILKNADRLGLKTRFISNTWGIDESTPKIAGAAANDRAYVVTAEVPYGYDCPGMKPILEYASPGPHLRHFVKGWVTMLVMWEGMKRVKGEITGPKLKAALETLRDLDTGGLTPRITFTSTDHRPSTTVNIYRIHNGEFQFIRKATIGRDPKYLGW